MTQRAVSSPSAISRAPLFLAVALLLLFFASRLPALDALPLHNDEGLHLTRAAEVWNGHPFWEIRDGKIINHWLIAAFYPPGALPSSAVFAGRIATLFVAVIGLAAGIGSARRLQTGIAGILFVATLWTLSGYLTFYERLAFSDAQAGALVVVAFWAALRVIRTGNAGDAVLTGASIALAMLFKFTAAPYTLSVLLLILFGSAHALRRRLTILFMIGVVITIAFIPPVAYLVLRGDDLFSIALGWIGVGAGGTSLGWEARVLGNLARFWQVWNGFDFVLPLGSILAFALFMRRRSRRLLGLVAILPFLIMVVLGREVLPRHFVVVLPLFFVILGTITGAVFQALSRMLRPRPRRLVWTVWLGVIGIPLISSLIRATALSNSPLAAPIPRLVYEEHVTSHSSGYGLREAVIDLQTLDDDGTPVIASMFPDSCLRANFYADSGVTLTCSDAPAIDLITTTYQHNGRAYVLVESAGLIGADIPDLAETLGAHPSRIAAYPRPGEREADASVVLWLLD